MDPCELAAKQAVVAAFPLHSPDALHKADCTVLTVCQMPWRLDVVRAQHLQQQIRNLYG